MAQTTELRGKLEQAIRNNQQTNTNIQKEKTDMQITTSKMNMQPAKPTIKLKTDFSNFS